MNVKIHAKMSRLTSVVLNVRLIYCGCLDLRPYLTDPNRLVLAHRRSARHVPRLGDGRVGSELEEVRAIWLQKTGVKVQGLSGWLWVMACLFF